MINTYQECEEYAKNILQRIPVLRTKQLARALYQMCPNVTSLSEAMFTLKRVQRKGYLFMSPDGFTVTRGAYSVATNDRLLKEIDTKSSEFAIPKIGPELQKKRLITNAMDCFWIVCDFLPYSYEFIANLTPPWAVCFDVKSASEKSKVYEITKIKRGDSYQTSEILKALPQVAPEAKDNIIRIAVLEDPREKDIVPPLGFKFICTIDESRPRGYTIIEKREGKQIWG